MSAEQILNRNNTSIASNENANDWSKTFPGTHHIGMNSIKTGVVQKNIDQRIFRQDGEVRWISLNAVPLLSSDKHPIQVISTFSDITDMKKILNDLKQVQLLFDISHDLMVITNLEGYFKRINPRFINVLGYSINEIHAQKFVTFVHSEDVNNTETELSKALMKKETIHFINRYKTKINQYRIFDWLVVPDNESGLLYFTARDITDYQSSELDLIHSSKVYSMGELTGSIVFSINAQLSIIRGHVSFLLTQGEQGPIAIKELNEKIKSIDQSLTILSKTTKDLASFASHIESENATTISLNRILENIISLCKERFRIHGVRLELKIENELVIFAKASSISHLFLSILNLAYDSVHSERDSWVNVSACNHDKKICVTISKSGTLEESYQLKIINLCKNILRESNGLITFELSGPNHPHLIIEFPKELNTNI
jgi:PAS domain S-box-containing protein